MINLVLHTNPQHRSIRSPCTLKHRSKRGSWSAAHLRVEWSNQGNHALLCDTDGDIRGHGGLASIARQRLLDEPVILPRQAATLPHSCKHRGAGTLLNNWSN
jgi:hypothetical protein